MLRAFKKAQRPLEYLPSSVSVCGGQTRADPQTVRPRSQASRATRRAPKAKKKRRKFINSNFL